MRQEERTLARRLGVTTHVSPLRYRLQSLRQRHPSVQCECLEDWLVDVANRRGARIVVRNAGAANAFIPPSEAELSNEQLVVALCQPQCLDRPQILRLAAQLVSRGAVRLRELRLVAARERVEPVLAELARQALHAEPRHPLWTQVAAAFAAARPLRSPVLHWTRLAQPVMRNGRCNAETWKLVA